MAREIIGSNLNTMGNAGQFETDRSTWGFPDNSSVVFQRSNLQKTAGLYSCQCFNTQHSPGPFTVVGLASCRFPAVAGKNYVIKAKVFVPSSLPIADGARVISIGQPALSNLVDEVTKMISEATDTWVDIEIWVTATSTPPFDSGHHTVSVRLQGEPETLSDPHGFLYIDQFEVYEWIEGEEEECTLAIDLDNTVVTNETSPASNDGSITVAVTGDVGTVEYRINGGSWQESNQFTGLDSGPHLVEIRDLTTECEDSQVIAVNADDIDFDFTLSVTHETVSGAHDGVITATVSGTGGPFTFSKDGENYQGSNTFTDLAPGDYFITVKNDAGDTLTKPATVNPGVTFERAWFSKNPVTLLKQATAGWEMLNNYRLYDDVRVEDEAGTSVYNSKLKVDQPPSSDGSVLFSVRAAFRDVLRAIPPDHNETSVQRITDRIKYFKHFTGELEEDETEPETLEASLPQLVLLGGLSTLKWPSMDFFSSYLPSTKKFMSWAPLEKQVDRLQEDYLNFWVYSAGITALKVRIKAYYNDDTNETATIHTVTGVQKGYLYQIPAGPINSGVIGINPAKTLLSYELSLLDQSDAVISEVRTFVISSIRHPRTRFFMFLNSLGAYEVHRFTGVGKNSAQYTGEIFERYLPPDYTEDDIQLSVDGVVFQNKGSFSSGYLTGKHAAVWLSYYRDMLRTPNFYDVTSGTRVPMVITTRELTWGEDQNHERFIRFEAVEAFTNESHTPEDI